MGVVSDIAEPPEKTTKMTLKPRITADFMAKDSFSDEPFDNDMLLL
jgi:hypothetical protein